VIVAPLTRLGITRSSVTRTGDTADGYRVIAARRLNRAHTSLSLLELGLIAIVLGIATAVAVPEYLDLRQDARDDSARSRLTQATQTLERRHVSAGTYAGAALPAGVHVRIVGPKAFCVETMAGGDAWHVSRGSTPVSGACPGP
jgi:hypothetical protein